MSTQTSPSTTAGPPASDQSGNPGARWRWWALVVLSIAQLMVILDSSVLSIALPSAQLDLGFSNANRQWIVTAYALAFGSLLLVGGRVGDFIGRKNVLIIGLVGFAAASGLGGLAQNFGTLVTARALQGGFAALLAPAGLALLSTTFSDPKERGRAFGVYGAIGGGGGAIGLLLGGSLTEYASWRWCMFINIAFAIVAIAGALIFLRRTPREDAKRIDYTGMVLVSAGLFAIVFGFSEASTQGWNAPTPIISLIAAGVLLIAFFLWQTRSRNPLLPLRVLRSRIRGGAFLAMLISGAVVTGDFIFETYYMQSTLHYSALQSGVAYLPMTAALIIAAMASSAVLARHISPRILLPGGMLLGGVAMWIMTGITAHDTYAQHLLPQLILLGMGMGVIFATSLNLATLGVRDEDAGIASAVVQSVQQIGGSIGAALLNTVSTAAIATYLITHAPTTATVATQAGVQGYVTAFWWSTAFFIGGAILTVFVLPSGVPAEFKSAPTFPESMEAEAGLEALPGL